MKRWLFALCWLVGVLVGFPLVARAAPIEVRASAGQLPLELAPKGGSFSAKLLVENRGAEPVSVELALREGSDTDPRLPVGLSVKFAGADKTARLEPGQPREVEIELNPLRGRRFHEVYGHVLITPEGGAPIAAGFHAAVPGAEVGPSGRLLSLAWLVPLLGALILLGLRGREPRPGAGRVLWVGAAAVQLGLLAWAVSRFDVLHTRFAGSEGVQLVERMPLLRALGVEYYLGVDGTTLVLTLCVSLLGLLAALLAEGDQAARFGGFALLIDAGLAGAFVSLDLGLMLVFWLLVVVASSVALARAGDARLGRGTAIALGLGFLLVAFTVWQLSGTASAAYLLDGAPAPRVFSLTELAHGGFVPRATALFGAHPTKVVYVCLFLGAALTLGAAPFGGWLAAVTTRAPTFLALSIGGGVTLLGVHALCRIGFAALPDGARWASLAVAVFGLLGTLYASLLALVSDEPRRFAAHALSATAGVLLLGSAALTAAGLQGALLLSLGRALTLALLLGVLGMARAPDGSSLAGRIARGSPMLAALGAVAWLGAALGPGTLAFTGAISALFGGLPTLRAVALVEAFALVLLAAAVVRSYRRTFLGVDTGPRVAAALPAERELSVTLAAAILLVVLGLWPRPLLRLIDSSCLDQAEQVNPPGALEVVQAPRGTPERLASAH